MNGQSLRSRLTIWPIISRVCSNMSYTREARASSRTAINFENVENWSCKMRPIKMAIAALFLLGVPIQMAQAEERTLNAEEIKSMIVGKTIVNDVLWMNISKDGKAWGTNKGKEFVVKYEITNDGMWCRTTSKNTRCQSITFDGNIFRWYNEDGKLSTEAKLE
ncbi:MAG: hypothetical protein ABJO09_05880 [Hyphomicrobiales bacterium]|uniref:hypothetical protein n=1 Tax=Alphaproteobacteria TaxID=28211 RepID=UPI003299A73B